MNITPGSDTHDLVDEALDLALVVLGECRKNTDGDSISCIQRINEARRKVFDALAANAARRAAPNTWRCFHCNECFTSAGDAREHFGASERSRPGCRIDLAEYRAMEERMHCYDDQDSELHRYIAGMVCDHQTALRHAAEKGYVQALRDTGCKEPGLKMHPKTADHAAPFSRSCGETWAL